MTEVVLCGALGRMGKAILRLSLEYQDVRVVAGVEHPDCLSSTDLGQASGIREFTGVPLTSRLEEVIGLGQVVLDFSGNPEAAVGHARLAAAYGKGVVIGTTGLERSHLEDLRELSKDIPVLVSPNMSLGVNLLIKLVELATKVLKEKGFDVEILEIHHRYKKDAPSGTALRLAEVIRNELGDVKLVSGREGIAPRGEEVGVMALRGGDVVGEHTVFFIGNGERLELTHRATSRDIFARGAIEACRWIASQKPGFYSMMEVLGL